MKMAAHMYQNICTHSVAESKTRDLVIVFILLCTRSFWYITLARVDNAPCKKTDKFSLDLSEMHPVNVVTLLLCQKHQLRCDHSITISQRSGQFRNGVVYIFCVMYSLIIHFGIK